DLIVRDDDVVRVLQVDPVLPVAVDAVPVDVQVVRRVTRGLVAGLKAVPGAVGQVIAVYPHVMRATAHGNAVLVVPHEPRHGRLGHHEMVAGEPDTHLVRAGLAVNIGPDNGHIGALNPQTA